MTETKLEGPVTARQWERYVRLCGLYRLEVDRTFRTLTAAQAAQVIAGIQQSHGTLRVVRRRDEANV